MANNNEKHHISLDWVEEFAADFKESPQHRLFMNAIIKSGIQSVAMDHQAHKDMQFAFSNEIDTGKITAQQQSGRCWLFAGLNVLRKKVATSLHLKNFEFSQNYPLFWDKLEKINYFYESILDTLDEDIYSRILMWLLRDPLQDGGQWDMFANLVNKYGLVPKYVMPETFHSSQTRYLNTLLSKKVRKDAAILRVAHQNNELPCELRERKKVMLKEVYRVLCLFLGEPPTRFDFEYREDEDTTKTKFHRESNITPLEFYQQFVQEDLQQFVSVINAPTSDKPFNKTYTIEYLNNVYDGNKVIYLNVNQQTLKQLTLAQLKSNELVWFGCDVGQWLDRDAGIMNDRLYNYSQILNTPIELTKDEQLDYGESRLTHAMVFTGVNLVNDQPNRWKVENSWGEEPGNQGFFVMSDSWFDTFLYQVVIHKKYLSNEHLAALTERPVHLPPWDPMGSLARY